MLDELARLLNVDRSALEEAVPQLAQDQAQTVAADLCRFLASPEARKPVFHAGDDALRSQILQYHASDLMTDRERAQFLGLPEGCRIRERAKILAPSRLTCGKNIWIGEGAILDAQGGLTIGDNSQIGLGVLIWSHTSHLQAIAGETGVSRDRIIYKPTTIGANCCVMGPSVIGPGVTIGDGAIISPLTFVDRDVAPGERVSGPKSLKKLEQRVAAIEEALAKLGS